MNISWILEIVLAALAQNNYTYNQHLQRVNVSSKENLHNGYGIYNDFDKYFQATETHKFIKQSTSLSNIATL